MSGASLSLRPTKRAKSKEQKPLFSSPPPNPRSRGRGVTLWPVSPSLVRPRPLARALGGQVRWGTLGLAPGLAGLPFGPFAELGRVAGSGFSVRRRVWPIGGSWPMFSVCSQSKWSRSQLI